MPNRAKNKNNRLGLSLLLGLAVCAVNCTTQTNPAQKHRSSIHVLNRMFVDSILNAELESAETKKERAQETPSTGLPLVLETIDLDTPLVVQVTQQTSPGPGLVLHTEGSLPSNINLSSDTESPSSYIILHTSATCFNGKFGTLTSPLALQHPAQDARQFSGNKIVRRTYKKEAVEFIEPSLHAFYSTPFNDPSGTNQRYVFIGLRFTASGKPTEKDTVTYSCHQLDLLPYTREAIEAVLNGTPSAAPIHKVAQNLLKQFAKN